MPSIEQAKQAQQVLWKMLDGQPWLQSVQLGFRFGEGYRLLVNVSALTLDVVSSVPNETDGVVIEVVVADSATSHST